MSGQARRFRLVWVALLAIAGTVWGPAAASACGTWGAAPNHSCCAGTMSAGCSCCAPATASVRPEPVASVREPRPASGSVLPLVPTSCTCRPADPTSRDPLPSGPPSRRADDHPSELACGWLPPVGWPASALPFSLTDSPPAGPPHAPLYLRIARLII